MGSKRINHHKLMDAVSVTGTNTYSSIVQDINNLDNLFIGVVFVGTMTGTLTVLASADDVIYDTFVFDPVLTQPTGAGLQYSIAMNQVPAGWLKINYVNASGSGTLTVNFFAKDIN